jgi:hypothetical protein
MVKLGRPKSNHEERERVALYFPESLKFALERLAERLDRSENELAKLAITRICSEYNIEIRSLTEEERRKRLEKKAKNTRRGKSRIEKLKELNGS